jgi:hypothetical protein
MRHVDGIAEHFRCYVKVAGDLDWVAIADDWNYGM